MESLVFQNRLLNSAHSIWVIKLPWSYSDHFQWFNHVELLTGFHSQLTAKTVYYQISSTRMAYSVSQIL